VLVAEQELDRVQIPARFEQMRGEGVALMPDPA